MRGKLVESSDNTTDTYHFLSRSRGQQISDRAGRACFLSSTKILQMPPSPPAYLDLGYIRLSRFYTAKGRSEAGKRMRGLEPKLRLRDKRGIRCRRETLDVGKGS